MKSHFTARFFAANRAKLRQLVSSDSPIVLTANGQLQRTGDSAYSFQQESNFWYLTGLTLPDVILVLTPTHEYLIVPGRDTVRQVFDGTIDIEDIKFTSGMTQIVSEHSGWQLLRQEIDRTNEVLVAGSTAPYHKRHAVWANPTTGHLHKKLRRSMSGLQLTRIDHLLASLRVIKQPCELQALQNAIDITSHTITAVQNGITSFNYEFELEAAISHGFRTQGASGHSFTPIVANGQNSTTLHNVANNSPIDQSQLTVIDIGAEVEHYAADVTRTIASQPPSPRQRAVHQAVLDTQSYALTLLKPGTLLRDYEQKVGRFMGSQLKQLGLITHIDAESVRRYYPHATSHFLGLDVHDVGDYLQPLTENMVLTCEPGIYIPQEGIGTRIEDDVLITKTGHTVLSRACPVNLFHVQ